MLNYTITEETRREILHMLEWAEYGIREQAEWQAADPAGFDQDSAEELSKQASALGVLWDAINALQPVGREYRPGRVTLDG